MAIDEQANPTTWTLSFKHDNITILLYADPLTPIAALKDTLLAVLRERYPAGLSHFTPSSSIPSTEPPIPHPSDSSSIILGKRVNPNDDADGFEQICAKQSQDDTPKSVGLSDGSNVAWAYKEQFEERGFLVTRSTFFDDQLAEEAREGDDCDMVEREDAE